MDKLQKSRDLDLAQFHFATQTLFFLAPNSSAEKREKVRVIKNSPNWQFIAQTSSTGWAPGRVKLSANQAHFYLIQKKELANTIP